MKNYLLNKKMAELTPRERLFEICDYGKLRGRGLRALISSKPGDNILESIPVVFVLSNNVRGQCCDMCFTQGCDLQRCSKCKFARYCDRQCQKKDWKEHKIECERILRVSPNVPTDLVRLMARIMQNKHSDDALCKYLSQLVSHHEQFGELRKDAFTTIITVLKHFVGGKDFQKFSTAELFELFGKISCNCFTICDAELQPLGIGMYQTPTMLNHSCYPNCVVTFSQTKLLVHATEDIKEGDELTISYTELLCPSYQRKEDLRNRYYFECSCTKCLSSLEEDGLMLSLQCSDKRCCGAVPRDLAVGEFSACNTCGKSLLDKTAGTKADTIILKSEEALKDIKALEKSDDQQGVLDIAERILAHQRGFFHKLHYIKARILDKAMDACINLEMWESALDFGLQTMNAYKLYYPINHPSVGIQLFRIGKLQVYLDKLKDGLQSLLEAEAILKTTYGNHALVQELQEMITGTLEELGREEHNNRFQGLELI